MSVSVTGFRWVAAVAVLMLACGCGFHLRSWDLQESLESAYVESASRHDLTEPLRRALRQAGVALAEDAASADMVIQLLNEREQRRSASVSGTARVTQYEMIYGVRYRVTDGGGTVLVPTQWVDRLEVYSVDRNNIVGSSEEQSLLQREMREDILQQILRTLAAVAPKAESAG